MEENEVNVRENLEKVRERIDRACARAGRDPKEVKLVAVSKTKPVSLVEEAYAAGQRVFGENKVQELCEKQVLLPEDVEWHMIGHLQRNKVKQVLGRAVLIHSVDSLRLAEQISSDMQKKFPESWQTDPARILLEVNVAREESKFGFLEEELEEAVEKIAKLPGIRVEGLMTSAPYVEIAEENRKYFRKLVQLSVDIAGKNIDNICMNTLSMGMSGDYEVAVEEGATMVRVGTGIFGSR